MNIRVVTIFPQAFPSTLGIGLIGKALGKLWHLDIIDLRNYGVRLDDRPFGGGEGMVLLPQVMENAIESNNLKNIIFLSPRGKLFNQEMSIKLSQQQELCIICGRYEGLDQRVIDYYQMQEVSLGDFILCGGESAALPLIETVIRNIPGVLGNEKSLLHESFRNDLLEHHQYTQPRIWKNIAVNNVLLSGHHQKIDQYRYEESLLLTRKRRPDLFHMYLINNLLAVLFIICAKITIASS